MGLLDLSVADIDPKEVRDHHGNRIRYWYEDVRIGPPKLDDSNRRAIDRRMMPTECRERGLTYEGPLSATIKYEINGVVHSIDNK
jgi:DNA-directed RNA polymerase I subunit RPA2